MPLHRLVENKLGSQREWQLSWDERQLVLREPGGGIVYRVLTQQFYRTVGEVEWDGKIVFPRDSGIVTFKPNPAASAGMRELVLAGLRKDTGFIEVMKRRAGTLMLVGSLALVVCGGLFGLYCWWASWAPEPPAWVRLIGWLIKTVLLVLMAGALAGPLIVFKAWKLKRQATRLEATLGGAVAD